MPQLTPLRFGTFISPVHSPKLNPTRALERDADLIVRLDELGFDEAWIGEHRSTGWEYVGAPDVMLATLIGRTRRIRLGTGVTSLPYHHPYNVAERMMLLDHLSRGRVILGTGPGALPYDAAALGIDPADTRRMMEESLEVILALLRGERVSKKTDWFTLDGGRTQLPAYSSPHLEVAVSSTHSPSGPRLAGRLGTSLLTFNASAGAGFDALSKHWAVVEEQSAEHGTTVDRRNWRLVAPMFLAETRDAARAAVRKGIDDWCRYMREIATLSLLPDTTDTEQSIDALVDSGFAVIGTPDDAIAMLHRLQERSGGFGTFLIWANDWADTGATVRSYELFADRVIPAFTPGHGALIESEEWARTRQPEMAPLAAAARAKAVADYATERSAVDDMSSARTQ